MASSNMISSGEGVRFSVVRVDEKKQLLSRPSAACLFDQFCGFNGEVLTVRIAMTKASDISAIALSFDHALCDITGASLLLSCISHFYCTVPLPSAIQPHHDRTMQSSIVPTESPTTTAISPIVPTNNKGPRTKKAGDGGSVCLQWEYEYSALSRLKESSCSFSRHDAIFADVISLLMATNLVRMETASISRNERESVHLPGLPRNHFGNGTNAVSVQLPIEGDATSISSAIRRALSCSSCGDNHSSGVDNSSSSDCTTTGSSSSHSSSGVSSRINSVFNLHTNTDIHLNTWWHALQGPLFGTKDISFAIGPRTLSSAGRMCSSRGQPNLTVVPSCRSGEGADGSEGGVRVYLLAPLQAAHAVLKILRKRVKESSSPVGRSGGCGGRPDPHEKSTIATLPLCEEVVPPAPPSAPSAALIWLHGLGDASDMWKSKLENNFAGRRLQHVKCLFPRATEQAVTCHGGDSHCSWFDIQSLPVSPTEPGDPVGLKGTIAAIYSLIESLKREGIPPHRVVLGGFSQGGAVAIIAGMTFMDTLCGIVSISGWCVKVPTAASSVTACATNSTVDTVTTSLSTEKIDSLPSMPVKLFFSCGSGDPIIDYELSKSSMETLKQNIGIDVTTKTYQRAKHMPTSAEMVDIQNFISELFLNL